MALKLPSNISVSLNLKDDFSNVYDVINKFAFSFVETTEVYT